VLVHKVVPRNRQYTTGTCAKLLWHVKSQLLHCFTPVLLNLFGFSWFCVIEVGLHFTAYVCTVLVPGLKKCASPPVPVTFCNIMAFLVSSWALSTELLQYFRTTDSELIKQRARQILKVVALFVMGLNRFYAAAMLRCCTTSLTTCIA